MDKNKFWDRYNFLIKNPYINHYELEKLINNQLDEEGIDFFKDSETVLGRFESTLPKFCQACENNIQNLNQYMLINLLFSYVHLNDLKNARHIRQILKEDGFDDERPTMLDGIDDFLPSANFFQGRYITAKYDKRIEDLGKYLISDLGKVEEFIIKEWKDFLPKRMFFNLINGIGPSPFNLSICEAYFKVGHFYKSKFILDYFSGGVVHEISHFIKNNFLKFPIQKAEISSFKFINEGYAEWKRTEYLKKHSEYKIYADNCSYHILGSNLFELFDLKNKWSKIMFNYLNFPILETATSFTYFLEDKFCYDKTNKIFNAMLDYPEVKTWTDYLKTYFAIDLEDLMQEWKNNIIENNGNKESISESIITYLQVEKIDNNEIILHYKSKYPLWAGQNIFIYDDKMNLQSIDKVEKYRFLKEGRLKMNPVKSDKLTIFAHFFQYSQQFEFNLEDKEIFL